MVYNTVKFLHSTLSFSVSHAHTCTHTQARTHTDIIILQGNSHQKQLGYGYGQWEGTCLSSTLTPEVFKTLGKMQKLHETKGKTEIHYNNLNVLTQRIVA